MLWRAFLRSGGTRWPLLKGSFIPVTPIELSFPFLGSQYKCKCSCVAKQHLPLDLRFCPWKSLFPFLSLKSAELEAGSELRGKLQTRQRVHLLQKYREENSTCCPHESTVWMPPNPWTKAWPWRLVTQVSQEALACSVHDEGTKVAS